MYHRHKHTYLRLSTQKDQHQLDCKETEKKIPWTLGQKQQVT